MTDEELIERLIYGVCQDQHDDAEISKAEQLMEKAAERICALHEQLVSKQNLIEALEAEVERLREAKPVAIKVKPLMWVSTRRYHPHKYQARCELTGDYYYASSDEEKMKREAVRATHILSALDVQPGFTADDLQRAVGAVWDEYQDSVENKWTFRKEHIENAILRALTPPADLADKVKEVTK